MGYMHIIYGIHILYPRAFFSLSAAIQVNSSIFFARFCILFGKVENKPSKAKLGLQEGKESSRAWKVVPLAIMWVIWKERSRIVFEGIGHDL